MVLSLQVQWIYMQYARYNCTHKGRQFWWMMYLELPKSGLQFWCRQSSGYSFEQVTHPASPTQGLVNLSKVLGSRSLLYLIYMCLYTIYIYPIVSGTYIKGIMLLKSWIELILFYIVPLLSHIYLKIWQGATWPMIMTFWQWSQQ